MVVHKLLCDRYDLVPEECLFLDDRAGNVDAAIACGMQSIVFTDYASAKDYLEI